MKGRFFQMRSNFSITPSLTNLSWSYVRAGSSLARPCLEVNFWRLLDIGVDGWVRMVTKVGSRHLEHLSETVGRRGSLAAAQSSLGQIDEHLRGTMGKVMVALPEDFLEP